MNNPMPVPDFGKNDPGRTGNTLTETFNRVGVWIPGIGIAYNVTPDVQSFLGVHRGFAPPGAREGTKPEKSVNYELGTRINHSRLNIHTVLFFSGYQNLLGSDLEAAGGGGSGDQFNAGQAFVYGAEAEASLYLKPAGAGKISIPLTLAYTYTDGRFRSTFMAENEDWGQVREEDHLPYLANHQLAAGLSVEHPKVNLHASAKYLGSMRTAPGKGDIPASNRIDGSFILDLSANGHISREITIFCSVNNLLDEVYAVARRPAGLRPGLPKAFLAGVKARL